MRTLLLAALLALPLPLSAQDAVVVDGELGKAIDAAVQADPERPFWGVVLAARGGKVVLAKGYGAADYARRPNDPRTLFEIASTSKMFTAIAILKLEMQGRLKTADPISKFFKGVPADKKEITVQHLLNHTSGISGEALLGYASRETAEEFVALAMKQPLSSKTGTKFEYCNPGYALLGVIIEKASGKKFEEYLREAIFKPAGMKDSGFVQDKGLDAARATVRRDGRKNADVGTAIEWGWGWGYRGMGGIVTTAYDLFRFDRAMRGETILNAAAKAKHQTPAMGGFGAGCQVATLPGGQLRVSHGGSVAGYLCTLDRFPDEDTVLIILSNDQADIFGVQARLTDALFPQPTASLTVNLKAGRLNEHGGLVLTQGSWGAKATADGVALSLDSADGAPVRVTMSRETATWLEGRLEALIREGKAAGKDDDGSMRAGVNPEGLEPKDGVLELPRVTVRIDSDYEARDAGGQVFRDPRITVTLIDRDSGRWPVLAFLSPTVAGRISASLREALGR
ncbi:MAG: beta-lactamase family protein [Candidatus Brocadiae bacterium]|nr:beta-lactamase family protein [Candidatus Brocadiia bacterium]